MFFILVLFMHSAFADPPFAPAAPTLSRTEELLLRIVRVLEDQASRATKVQATMTRWEYRCIDQFGLQSSDSLAASLNALGGEGWELTGVLGAPAPGTVRYCFKRPSGTELLSAGGELGCNPVCGGSETCYKGVCINACTPACADDQYCGNDHRCRTRTRPRK
jgi:hypothetical protein